MSRKFIATILAGALAVTGFTAAPARADAEDIAKALAGIAALAIIAKAIDDDKDRKAKKKHHVTRQDHVRIDPVHPRAQRHHGYDIAPKPLPQRVARKQLPAQCLVRVDSRDGVRRAFGERCLQRNYRHANRLPHNCAINVRGRNHDRTLYEARCLRSYGYSLARW